MNERGGDTMIRKDLVIAILATFCLTSVLFSIPASSSGIWPYNPWWDITDDGKIDVQDIARVVGAFGTYGTPINKTQLLLDLQAKIDSLNSTVVQMQNAINYLNTTVINLNLSVIELNATKGLGPPDYDSGWVSFYYREIRLTHNLGTTNLLVYMVGKDLAGQIHHCYYGGENDFSNRQYGAYWGRLFATTIDVFRGSQDPDSTQGGWVEFRVMMWKIP